MGITRDFLKSLLDYDPNTGQFRWLRTLSPVAPAGSVAGTIYTNGRRYITISRKRYFAHHLAWLYVTGEWPSAEVDHRNLDRDDNRFENLRLASDQQQSANRRVSKNNRIGVKGVGISYEPKKASTAPRYRARIRVDNRLIHIGYFPTPEAANQAYAEAAVRHFGEFARSA